MNLSVILPTYSEAGHIVNLIKEVLKIGEDGEFNIEVVLVDDNSPDGTNQLVKESFQGDERIKIFVRESERGLASAIHFGIRKATNDYLVVMDTDFNHHPNLIPKMARELKDFDIVVGSRFISGGGMEGPQFRYWASYFFNIFIKFILGVRTNDNLSGFFVTSQKVIKDLDCKNIFDGYGDYFIRLLYQASRKGFSILEMPVFYQRRPSGKSKTSFIFHTLGYIVTIFKVRFGK